MAPSTRFTFHLDEEENLSQTSVSPSGSNNSTSPRSKSDKENDVYRRTVSKRKQEKNMAPASSQRSGAISKRQRLGDHSQHNLGTASQAVHQRRLRQVNDTDFYDPDQDPEERRRVRQGLRDLAKDLNGRLSLVAHE